MDKVVRNFVRNFDNYEKEQKMGKRFHVSSDGVVRPCRAKTPETCRAKGLNGERAVHFNNEEEADQFVENYYEDKLGVFNTVESFTLSSKNAELEMISPEQVGVFANSSKENFEVLESIIEYRVQETAEKYDQVENCNPSNLNAGNAVSDEIFNEMSRDLKDYNDTTDSFIEAYTQSRFYSPKFLRKNLKKAGKATATTVVTPRQRVLDQYDKISGSDIAVLINNDFSSDKGRFNQLKVYGLENSKLVKRELLESEVNSNFLKNKGSLYKDQVWRQRLKDDYALRNPNKVLISSETNYQSDEREWQQVNFDGIVIDPISKNPEGLVKIKVDVNYDDWKDELPLSYKGEALYYLDSTGLKYVDVIIKNKRNETRTFRVEKDDEIIPGVRINDYIQERVEPWFTDIKKQRKKG